jgi:hypothetical protein
MTENQDKPVVAFAAPAALGPGAGSLGNQLILKQLEFEPRTH